MYNLIQLQKEKQELEEEKVKGLKFIEKNKNSVKLNVGGINFQTSLSNLTKLPSMLSTMFSGRFETEKDETGSVFIDRDGMWSESSAVSFSHCNAFSSEGEVVQSTNNTIRNTLSIHFEFPS